MRQLLLFAAAIAWTAICARALAAAYRSGQIAGRVSIVDRQRRPSLFALNLAGLWLAFALGPAAMLYAWRMGEG